MRLGSGADRRGPIRRSNPKIESPEQQRCEQSAVGDQRADQRQPRWRFGHLGVRRHADAMTDWHRTVVARETGALRGEHEQAGGHQRRDEGQQVELEQKRQHRRRGRERGEERQVGRLRQHDQLLGLAGRHVYAQRLLPAIACKAEIAFAPRQRQCEIAGGDLTGARS